jgi:general secretion pathway protein F
VGQFQYRAADAEGKVVEGTIDAPEQASVIARLQDRGLIPIRIAVAGERKASAGSRFSGLVPKRRAGSRDLLILTQELSALIGAGLPLDRSLVTLHDLADHPDVKAAVGDVLTQVRGGKGLADALAQHRIFPPLYVNMVRAGEIGGFLEASLTRLAEYLERSEELKSDVIGAMIYPAFLMLSLGGSMLFLLVYVLPKFSDLFEGMGQALPLPARIVMAVSTVIRSYWWLLPLLGVAVWYGFRRWVSTPAGRLQADQLKLRLPGLGTILRKLEVARFCRTLGTLLRSGVPMVQALTIVREIAGNAVLARALGDVEVGVREGAGVAVPLARSGTVPALAIQMISVGEETGRLDEMMLRVAEHYDREVRAQIQRFTRLLEPVMIVFMALLVGFVVISMLNAVFSLNDLPM